ncbi:S1C family serine protease [Planctomycetota bacterium]
MDFELPRKQPPPGTQRGHWLTLLLLLLVVMVFALQLRQWFASPLDPNAQPRAVMARGDLAEDEKTTIDLFEQASPSVVFITSVELRRMMFSFRATEIPKGTGSGFIWDDKGTIVTNYHVIQGATSIYVTLSDQSHWEATFVGAEPDKDLAVVRIDAPREHLRALAVGTSNDLQVGQKVFAIGNPFGLDQTLTTGIISGLGREIQSVSDRPIQGVIQTDAAINPGNSGGPLLDSAGRVIGINTAIYSPSGAYAGVGFAVPVDVINHIVPQLIRYGKVRKPTLGISEIPDSFVRSWGLKGILFYDVARNSGAQQAGLQATRQDRYGRTVVGDLIVGMDDHPIRNSQDYYRALDNYDIGDTVTLTLVRGRNRDEVKVEVVLRAGE